MQAYVWTYAHTHVYTHFYAHVYKNVHTNDYAPSDEQPGYRTRVISLDDRRQLPQTPLQLCHHPKCRVGTCGQLQEMSTASLEAVLASKQCRHQSGIKECRHQSSVGIKAVSASKQCRIKAVLAPKQCRHQSSVWHQSSVGIKAVSAPVSASKRCRHQSSVGIGIKAVLAPKQCRHQSSVGTKAVSASKQCRHQSSVGIRVVFGIRVVSASKTMHTAVSGTKCHRLQHSKKPDTGVSQMASSYQSVGNKILYRSGP